MLAMRSEESFFHETHQERIQKKPQHVQRSLNQRVLSPCLLSNRKRPLPRNPQRKHVQKNWVLCNGKEAVSTKPTKPKYTSRRSLNRSVWSPWLLCNGKEAFSTKPTKKHVQEKSKPERFETADSPALRDHQTTSKRSPPRDTSKRSLNQCVLNPSPDPGKL